VPPPAFGVSAAQPGLRDRIEFPARTGALFALGGRLCLDYASRPDAFERLYPKLLHGYLLDAIEQLDGTPTNEDRLAAFTEAIFDAPCSRPPSAGLGVDLRLAADTLVASGLELEGELIQLCAFTSITRGTQSRISPPSRRA
jgi:hypothetical protein